MEKGRKRVKGKRKTRGKKERKRESEEGGGQSREILIDIDR